MIENEVTIWLKRLDETFSGSSKVIGESLLPIIEWEHENEKKFIDKFRGYDIILNAFEGFYIETLQLAAGMSQKRLMSRTLQFITAMHVVNFRRFRASHILFLKGYPFDAVALLRGLFECVLELAAIGHEIVSVNELYEELSDEDNKLAENQKIKKMRNSSIKIEKKVNAFLIGKNSGLSNKVIESIEVWKWLLHKSVHKSFTAIAMQCGQWLKRESRLSLLPIIDDEQTVFCMNTSCEIAWMLLRTFPLLQISPLGFGNDWEYKWKVLDDSFQKRDMGLARDIPSAIKEFINKKLDFGNHLCL